MPVIRPEIRRLPVEQQPQLPVTGATFGISSPLGGTGVLTPVASPPRPRSSDSTGACLVPSPVIPSSERKTPLLGPVAGGSAGDLDDSETAEQKAAIEEKRQAALARKRAREEAEVAKRAREEAEVPAPQPQPGKLSADTDWSENGHVEPCQRMCQQDYWRHQGCY